LAGLSEGVKSSIMQVNPTVRSTHAPGPDRGSLKFWFKRSDFYVTGLDFVCSRVAIMT